MRPCISVPSKGVFFDLERESAARRREVSGSEGECVTEEGAVNQELLSRRDLWRELEVRSGKILPFGQEWFTG
jgi:hypothetical protein